MTTGEAGRRHHATLWLCVDNNSLLDRSTDLREHSSSNDRCQRPGISRRVRHLRTFQSDAPSAIAVSAIAGQRSAENISSERDNLAMPTHRDDLSPLSRPSVPLREIPSLRCLDMPKSEPLSVYRGRLKQRMKDLRKREGLTQRQVADSLQVNLEAYKKWENRGGLPIEFIERFALLFRESVAFVVTGRDADATLETTGAPYLSNVPKRRVG